MKTVSIPQAVSTVATRYSKSNGFQSHCFNTASGKYCCNVYNISELVTEVGGSFNTASGKYCCNKK